MFPVECTLKKAAAMGGGNPCFHPHFISLTFASVTLFWENEGFKKKHYRNICTRESWTLELTLECHGTLDSIFALCFHRPAIRKEQSKKNTRNLMARSRRGDIKMIQKKKETFQSLRFTSKAWSLCWGLCCDNEWLTVHIIFSLNGKL